MPIWPVSISQKSKDAVEDAKKRVFEELEGKACKEGLEHRYYELFNELTDKAERCNNVATLQNVKLEADALKVRLLDEIAEWEKELTDRDEDEPVAQKKTKTVSIKSINNASTRQIQSAKDADASPETLRKKLPETPVEDTTVHIVF